jgi:hypothetical protein
MNRRSGRRGRPSRLELLTAAQLHAELERRKRLVPRLTAQRDQFLEMLSRIDDELRALGTASIERNVPAPRRPGRPPGSGRGGRGPRAKNTMSLVEALKQALKDRTLSISDAVAAVNKLGYKSKSKTFRGIVNQALLANRKLFKKVGRGLYRGV